MKRLYCIATALLLIVLGTTNAEAQKEKVVDRSREARPSWIGCSTTDYIAVTEVGESLAEATDKAMNSVRQHILSSVAVNVVSTEVMLSRHISLNDMCKVMSNYSSTLMTEAAKIPYLSDISASNAADSYWERIYSRAEKYYRYEFSILYRFTEEMRKELVAQFVEIDNRKMAELERLKSEFESIDDLDRVKDAVYALEALEEYFFDATRRGEAEALRRSYNALYSRVTIAVEEQGEEYCIFSLRIGERRVRSSVGARLRSDAALEMSVEELGGGRYKLTYNGEYASPKDLNSIEIVYPFGGVSVDKTIYFEPTKRE